MTEERLHNVGSFKYKDQKVTELLSKLVELLPHDEAWIWAYDDDEILCDTGQTAETIADLIDAMYGCETANTGYYDPEEDERNGETDRRTGYYYVTIN